MLNRWRFVAAVAAVTAMVLVPASLSSAQNGPTETCTGDLATSWPDVGFGMGWKAAVFASTSAARPGQRTVAASIPAGTYVVDTVAYDGYVDRSTNSTQELEQYFLEFLEAGGAVLATTGLTPDLANGTEATWSGSVGEVTLNGDAVAVRAVHRFAGQDLGNQSVMPACFSVTTVGSTTTTTLVENPTTTLVENPTTTLVENPTTTLVENPTTTVIEPPASSSTTTVPVASTTSTVPTEVLPEVQEAPDPTPVAANPDFTG